MISEWIICPICGNKTRDRVREDTVLKNYPLYCPKCKKIYSKWSNMMRIPSYKLKKDNIKLIKVTGREKSITAQFSKLKCSDGFDCVLKNSESGEKIIMKNQKKNTVIFKI